jgi:ABC-type polysaccharide/polyol phosphate transport system ATPase subunit
MKDSVVVENLSKKFRIGFRKNKNLLFRIFSFFSGKESKKPFFVLKNLSFRVKKGSVLGVIGKNGSGKSTLLRIIGGIYKPTIGSLSVSGNVVSVINLKSGLIDLLTMKENIFLICSFLGLSKKQTEEKMDSIVDFSGLADFMNTKVYQFSEGMRERLSFSIAVNCSPDVLLLDEVFEVGDQGFKRKSSEKIKEMSKKKVSVVIVTHDLDIIRKYCDRVIWLDKGEAVEKGEPERVIKNYLNFFYEDGYL